MARGAGARKSSTGVKFDKLTRGGWGGEIGRNDVKDRWISAAESLEEPRCD